LNELLIIALAIAEYIGDPSCYFNEVTMRID
jgi:hypothetical protein